MKKKKCLLVWIKQAQSSSCFLLALQELQLGDKLQLLSAIKEIPRVFFCHKAYSDAKEEIQGSSLLGVSYSPFPVNGGCPLAEYLHNSLTGCQARFVLKYNHYDKYMEITQAHMTHNHLTTQETFLQERPQKLLTAEEKKIVKVRWIYCVSLFLNVWIFIHF